MRVKKTWFCKKIVVDGRMNTASYRRSEGEFKEKKAGPGPVMVSDTLSPAVHILGHARMHLKTKGTQGFGPWGS